MLYVNPMESATARAADGLRANLASSGKKDDLAKEKEALQEFERLFLFQMLREMRKTVPKDALFGGSNRQEFMEEMLDDHFAGQMASSGQFGIAKQMEQQMHQVRRPAHYPGMELKPMTMNKNEHQRRTSLPLPLCARMQLQTRNASREKERNSLRVVGVLLAPPLPLPPPSPSFQNR